MFAWERQKVSIHAQRGGWAKQEPSRESLLKRVVSIHAQRGGWAKPAAFWVAPSSWLFQSTPSAVAGRNVVRPARKSERLGFNPRPARWLGETPGDCASHARCLGFNPRPARWLGETADLIAAFAAHRVSIHAQRGGWAKRSAAGDSRETDMFQSTPSAVAGRNAAIGRRRSRSGRFNPRPARWLGETSARVLRRRAGNRFNPRPARWLGETPDLPRQLHPHAGFNPRPARWLGETMPPYGSASIHVVSIHAQRGGWAKQEQDIKQFQTTGFQSTPSAVAGRNHDVPPSPAVPGGFNPRPARWLGETIDRLMGRIASLVSIHAQRGGWAKPLAALIYGDNLMFQSTPSAVAGRNLLMPLL